MTALPPAGDASPAVSGRLDQAPREQTPTPSAARGSALYLVGTIVGSVANFVMLAVIQRSYGTSTFGVFAGVTALFLVLATITRLGADTGVTWYVSRLLAQQRAGEVASVVRLAVGPVVVASVLATIVAIVFAQPIATVLTKEPTGGQFVSMLRILAFGVPLATVGEVLMGVTRGLGATRPTVVSSHLGRQAGQLVTVAFAAAVSDDVRVLAAAWVIPYLVPVVYPIMWLARSVVWSGERSDHGRAFWRYSGPQAANSSAQIGLEKFDILALGPLVSEVAAGQYSAANRLAHVAVLGCYAVNVAHAPMWARLFELGERRSVRTSARRATGWTILVVGPLLWSFVMFGGTWLGLIGGGLEDGGPALTVLSLTVLVALVVGPTENLLLMSGGSGRAFTNNLVALALNIGLNLVLIPFLEVVGAALAWAVAFLTVRGLAAHRVWKTTGVLVAGRHVVRVWLIVAVVCVTTATVMRLALGAGRAGLIAGTTASLIALAAVAWTRQATFSLQHLMVDLVSRRAPATQWQAPERADARPSDAVVAIPSLVGPHLEFALRSSAAIRQPFTADRVRRAIAAVPQNGWRGRAFAGAVSGLAYVAPGLVQRLPRITLHPNAPLPLPPTLVRTVLAETVEHVPRGEVDGVVWLFPPADDEVRFGALLLCGDEPVAHLRVRRRGRPHAGPRPALGTGPRSGVRFPLTLGSWTTGEVACEVTTVLGSGRHRPAVIDDDTLDLVIADIADALADSPRPADVDPSFLPMHGDLTPWNLRRDDRSGALLLFDWEYAGWGPAHCDLLRYCATADDGVGRFARRPGESRRLALDAVLYWRDVAQERYAVPAAESWKNEDRRREVHRLSALARLASPDDVS